jgi:hypothetical protein
MVWVREPGRGEVRMAAVSANSATVRTRRVSPADVWGQSPGWSQSRAAPATVSGQERIPDVDTSRLRSAPHR